jgi:hypothetical protein
MNNLRVISGKVEINKFLKSLDAYDAEKEKEYYEKRKNEIFYIGLPACSDTKDELILIILPGTDREGKINIKVADIERIEELSDLDDPISGKINKQVKVVVKKDADIRVCFKNNAVTKMMARRPPIVLSDHCANCQCSSDRSSSNMSRQLYVFD